MFQLSLIMNDNGLTQMLEYQINLEWIKLNYLLDKGLEFWIRYSKILISSLTKTWVYR